MNWPVAIAFTLYGLLALSLGVWVGMAITDRRTVEKYHQRLASRQATGRHASRTHPIIEGVQRRGRRP